MRVRFALVIAWATIIFIGSSFPNPPGASGGEWQYDLAHMVEYGVLGVLVFLALRVYRADWPSVGIATLAWLVAVLYGMSDEFHQSFVPNRDANWMDVGFDAVGAGIGIGLTCVLRGRWRVRRGDRG